MVFISITIPILVWMEKLIRVILIRAFKKTLELYHKEFGDYIYNVRHARIKQIATLIKWAFNSLKPANNKNRISKKEFALDFSKHETNQDSWVRTYFIKRADANTTHRNRRKSN